MANAMNGNNLCLLTANNRRVSVWACDWSNHLFPLVDWLTFPAHKHTINGKTYKKKKKVKYGVKYYLLTSVIICIVCTTITRRMATKSFTIL